MPQQQRHRIAIYPGSFDPMTNGHLDLIRRAARIADHLIVAVLPNSAKQPLLSTGERIQLIQSSTQDIPNVEVVGFDGLLSDFAVARDASLLIRGLRTVGDFEVETQMASLNRQLNAALETIFLPARPELAHISSRFVKEIHALGGDITPFVPTAVLNYLGKVH